MRLAFKIALRFLISNKGQTLLIVLGIAVGVSVQIFIGSLIQGLQISLIDKTIGNSPQITITSSNDDKLINNYREITDKLSSLNDEIKKISVVADSPALIKSDNSIYSVLIRGMEIKDSDNIYNIKDRIYEGREATDANEAIVGKELQKELNVQIGDELQIITNSGQINKLSITGFFDLKVASLNKSWVITTLETVQNIFSLGENVTGIEMQVTDVFEADMIAMDITSALDDSHKVSNWKAQNEELLSGLNGQSISSLMIQVFVLISVVLGIASVLAITVIQKSKQIGILKAMGIKDRTASFIFLFEGLLLGILGAIMGVIFGLLLSLMFTKFALNSDGTPVVALYIDYVFIGFSALIALSAAMIAALIPAWRTSKLNPIEVIKNG